MEEGNQTDVTSHAVNPGGCFDYADDDPLFKSIHGGEACMCTSLPYPQPLLCDALMPGPG